MKKNPIIQSPDQQYIAARGNDLARRGEHEEALRTFESLKKPIPVHAGLIWVAVLTHKRRFHEAIQVLSSVTQEGNIAEEDRLWDSFSCSVFEDVLRELINEEEPRPSALKKRYRRNRMLHFFGTGIPLVPRTLKVFGRIASSLGSESGKALGDLSKDITAQCWVHGLLDEPDFLDRLLSLKEMRAYEEARKVYRELFLAYLDYWLHTGENLRDFFQTLQKMGDAYAIYCMVREKRPLTIFEIGTFIGLTTCLMARALQENGNGKIYCVDPNMKHLTTDRPLTHARRMLKELRQEDRVEIHEGFFSSPIQESKIGISAPGKSFIEGCPEIDMALIDGDHRTAAVMEDLLLLIPRLNEKACVLIHDVRSWKSIRHGIVPFFRDDFWKRHMRYGEFRPPGFDGIGFIEVDKRCEGKMIEPVRGFRITKASENNISISPGESKLHETEC